MIRNSYLYAPYYCEENIWQLCQDEEFAQSESKVVLISNARRSCPLWFQRAGGGGSEPVFWDYHVILLCRGSHPSNGAEISGAAMTEASWNVFDFDTVLGLPVDFSTYVQQTFMFLGPPLPTFEPWFRVVASDEYAKVFSSSRNHMKDQHGQWLVPPPPWPAITQAGSDNLMELIDMEKSICGEVMDLGSFIDTFNHVPQWTNQT